MLGSKKEIKAALPDSYYKNIYEIDYSKLKKQNINAILFDIDNTIANVDDLNIPSKTKELFQNLKKQNFKILLFSNNHKKRVLPVARILNIEALYEADKPRKIAYQKALSILNSKKENTVAIGDQILSDIIGAKKYGVKAILVDQLSKKNNLKTGMAQKLGVHIENKLTKKNLFKQGKYYNWHTLKYLVL